MQGGRLWLFVVAAVLSLPCQPGFPSPLADTNKTKAVSYLRELPTNQKIIIFPNKRISYRLINAPEGIDESIARFSDVSRPFSYREAWGRLVQMYIIAYSDEKTVTNLLQKTGLNDSYTKHISTNALNPNGCTLVTFDSRKTWRSVGFALIDTTKIDVKRTKLDDCIHAAFDVIAGFPVDTNAVSKTPLPISAVRGEVMSAIYTCSTSENTDMDEPETSRDGVTARPSLACIISNIK